MSESVPEVRLFSVENTLPSATTRQDGGSAVSAHGRSVKVTRIGRRVFPTAEEVERIRLEGLPSLGKAHPAEHLSDVPSEAAT